jgi:separase
MAAKDDATRIRIQNVQADLKSTSTCSAATVAALQELLAKKDEESAQKENVKVKVQATARRRAGTATATAPTDPLKTAFTPRDKYILATEVANTTLKTLADALRSPPSALNPQSSSRPNATPSDDGRKSTKPRLGHTKSASTSKRPLTERSVSQMTNMSLKPAPRRSSSYSSIITPGPDAGLVATAECARIAFAYLGTLEATKVLGKDSQELQLESGVLALIGKLVAHGLDSLAVKEMRSLKKRLDKYLGHDGVQQSVASVHAKKDQQRIVPQEKESLASLLSFGTVDLKSPALPLIANLQIYALRVIAKMNRPRTIEATWEHLQPSNVSSPANLLGYMAAGPSSEIKTAKQLESLTQTILALCPSVSSSYDEKPLQPSPETVLLLQQLAFKIRKKWWAMAKHQGNEEQELLEPFTKCLTAFTRRSLLLPNKKYSLAEALFTELVGQTSESATTGSQKTAHKVLSSLAQAAGLFEEALRWLGPTRTSSPSALNQTKQTTRLIRIATVSFEALSKDDAKLELQSSVTDALEALRGNLGGSTVDLDALFVEVNALRRAATRSLVTRHPTALEDPTSCSIEQVAVSIIASSVHFSARFIGLKQPEGADNNATHRHIERLTTAWKCTKSIIDSVLMCCKQVIASNEQWMEVDRMLQGCSHIVHRFEEEMNTGASFDQNDHNVLQALPIKLSNAYWAIHLQLRKMNFDQNSTIIAMQRSISLLQSRSLETRRIGLLAMKLEQLGDMFESMDRAVGSRSAYNQCMRAHVESDLSGLLLTSTSTGSLQEIFGGDGPFSIPGRVLKSHYRTFIRFGLTKPNDLAFFDDSKLPPGVRGALLEWQLDLYLRTLARNRHWDSSLNLSVATLIEQLQTIYLPEKYPIRRLRVLAKLFQVFQSHSNILPKDRLPVDLADLEVTEIGGTEDGHLVRFETHLVALCRFKMSMQLTTPCISTLKRCFAAWECLVQSASTWDALLVRVDDIEGWLQDIQACVEYLNAKGEEYLALSVLHLLVKVGELRRSSDASQLAMDLCALALQFLRLGYTGKAGKAFLKAETLLKHQTVSVEAKLRWHIAYAEYLARIGNTLKW